MSLSTALAWVNRASHGRFNDSLVRSAMRHHRERDTDPAILVHAALVWLALDCSKTVDPVNQYWHIVDQVSAQVRSRYVMMDPERLI